MMNRFAISGLPQRTSVSLLKQQPARSFFKVVQRSQATRSNMLMSTLVPNRSFFMMNQKAMRTQNLNKFSSALTETSLASFSLKMRKVKAKSLAKRSVKKYKLKTKKAAQKRFFVVGARDDRAFKYHAVGHRHLNRNKSHRNRKAAKRRHILDHLADHKKMKRLLPYYKRRKFLSS